MLGLRRRRLSLVLVRDPLRRSELDGRDAAATALLRLSGRSSRGPQREVVGGVSKRIGIQSPPLTDWVTRRVGNLDRMLKEADKDDAALCAYSMVLLDTLAQLLTGVGDEAGSLYAASLARLLEQRHSALRRKRQKRISR